MRIIDNSEPCMAAVDGPNGPYGGHWLDLDMLEVSLPIDRSISRPTVVLTLSVYQQMLYR